MNKVAIALILVAHSAFAQDSFKCPHEYGFYPHERQCDKYWKCENNAAELKTCGNGLAFESSDPKYLAENCDYLHNVDCGERSVLEPAQSTPNCPRLYGIFPDEEKCDTFWSCWNGEASRYTCAPGLAYDANARVCMWADQVPECKVSQKDGGFQCPDPKNNPHPGTFSRHAHPEDCRKYYVCLDGNPREYGCPLGTVFKIGGDQYSGQCEDPEGVDGCSDYYGDELKHLKKSELLNNGNYNSATSKPSTRKKIPQAPKAKAEVQAQPTVQTSTRVQQVAPASRERVRPAAPVVQQQTTPAQDEPQPQRSQQRLRPSNQLSQRTQAQTTRAPPTTTQAPKSVTEAKAGQEEEYYYYDNYEDGSPAPAAGQKTQ